MGKFTKAEDEILVEFVKENRLLYDPSDENFKHNVLKQKRWEEISATLDISVSECKKRWKSLRDQYNKKRKGDLGGAERWEYTNLLSFLADIVGGRETVTDCNNHNMLQIFVEEQNMGEDQQWSDDQQDESIVDDVSHNSSLNTKDSNSPFKRRFIRRHPYRPMNKIITKRDPQKSALYEKMLNKALEPKTPMQKFFESMADTVDKLPPHLQAEVRLKVCQVVTETELKHHMQQSMQMDLPVQFPKME